MRLFGRTTNNNYLFCVFLIFLFQTPLMSQSRQLAAIMFTDIEGYTAIMQQNEQQALSLRKRHREVLQKNIHNTMAALFSIMAMGR